MGILATSFPIARSDAMSFPLLPAPQHDVSGAPCVLGDELQRRVDGSSGMLVRHVPPAAQQDPARQSAVHTEPVHQPGHSPAHPSFLPLHSLQGDQPAVM